MEFVRIKNRNNFLLHEIPNYHPESIKYLEFWRENKKRCIEGYWNIDGFTEDDGYRYMPGNLYFYTNFGIILHQPEDSPKTAPKKKIKPLLRDIEWEFFYNWLEARGFSGFSDDNEFSCCTDILIADEVTPHKSCYNSEGNLKKFMPARQYVRQVFKKPLGLPLYQNEAKNLMVLGSRGFGKSYTVGVGIILHELLFDGARVYNEESIKNPYTVEILVGAAMASKSADLLSKFKNGLNELPGAYNKGTEEEIPSPFYKKMAGSLEPNNVKNPFIHLYDKKIGGEWKKDGSGSNVKHVIFTIENPEAAAGTRPAIIVVEEVGLVSNLLRISGSNDAAQKEGTIKFGSAIYIGTGGNIEKIIESEIIFRDPEGHDFMAFDDIWENTGKIGWFVPAYYALNQFKDENGNTNVEAAKAFIEKRRANKKKARTTTALDLEMMNYPIIPSEIFLNKTNNKFPVADLKQTLGRLLTSDNLLSASYKGYFSIEEDGKVKWNNDTLTPIREFPVKKSDNIEGCWEIFQMPMTTAEGTIPYGRYIACLDPIDDDDNSDVTRSLQSTFIFDMFTDKIVAEYTGRTRMAKEYYEQVRRGLIAYNAQILYENQKKGFFSYFDTKNSTYLLADTPEMLKDMDMQKIITVGNRAKGIYATEPIKKWGIDLYAQWLLSQAVGMPDGVTNTNMLRSVGLIRESIMYSKDINADRISSIIVLMIYRETKIKYVENKKKESNKYDVRKDPFWDRHFSRPDKGYINQINH